MNSNYGKHSMRGIFHLFLTDKKVTVCLGYCLSTMEFQYHNHVSAVKLLFTERGRHLLGSKERFKTSHRFYQCTHCYQYGANVQ